jgi:hypothetical protein
MQAEHIKPFLDQEMPSYPTTTTIYDMLALLFYLLIYQVHSKF